MTTKQTYADKCFGLPVDQIRYFNELTPELKNRCHYYFGKTGAENFIYAVKSSGDDLVQRRERKRPEWETSPEKVVTSL